MFSWARALVSQLMGGQQLWGGGQVAVTQQADEVVFVAANEYAVVVGDEADGIDPEGVFGGIDAEGGSAVF